MLAILMALAIQDRTVQIVGQPEVTIMDGGEQAPDQLEEAARGLFLASGFDGASKADREVMGLVKRGGAHDSVWVVISRGRGSETMMRVKDIMSVGTLGSVWLKTVYKKDDNQGRAGMSLMSREQIDCVNETLTATAIVVYGSDGAIRSDITIPTYKQATEPVIPDSGGEKQLWAACLQR